MYGTASSGRFVDKEVMKEELNINNQNESIQVEKWYENKKRFWYEVMKQNQCWFKGIQ